MRGLAIVALVLMWGAGARAFEVDDFSDWAAAEWVCEGTAGDPTIAADKYTVVFTRGMKTARVGVGLDYIGEYPCSQTLTLPPTYTCADRLRRPGGYIIELRGYSGRASTPQAFVYRHTTRGKKAIAKLKCRH